MLSFNHFVMLFMDVLLLLPSFIDVLILLSSFAGVLLLLPSLLDAPAEPVCGRHGRFCRLPLMFTTRRGNEEEWPAGEARAVTIVGLKEGGNGEESDCNAADLSMLFRLQGPEALAEVG